MIKILKRFFLFLILLIILSCTRSSDALEFTADLNRGACATNYTRKAPGLCLRNTVNIILSTNSNTCTSTVISELPSNVKSVLLLIEQEVISSATVGLKYNSITFYDSSDSTCLIAMSNVTLSAYEWTAISSTILANSVGPFSHSIGANKTLVSQKETTGNTTNSYTVYIYGYTD